MVQGESRDGNTLVFDNWIGAVYNAGAPSNSSTIVIQTSNAVIFGSCAYYSSSLTEPNIQISDPNKLIVKGQWESGKIHLYYAHYNGKHFVVTITPISAITSTPTPNANILFQDVFGGTVINSGNWSVTNNHPTIVTFTQNDGLSVTSAGTGASLSALDNFMDSVPTFDASSELVMVVVMKNTNQDSYGGWTFGFSNGVDYLVTHSGAAGQGNFVRLSAAENNTTLFAAVEKYIDITGYRKFKLKVSPTGTAVSVWNPNGEFWDILQQDNHVWSTNNLKIRLLQGNNNADNAANNAVMTTSIESVTVYDTDFTGETP